MDRKPSRVPAFAFAGVYPLPRVGLTPKALFYDQWQDAALAHVEFHLDHQPDAGILNMACFTDQFQVTLDLQEYCQPFADHVVVVNEHDANG